MYQFREVQEYLWRCRINGWKASWNGLDKFLKLKSMGYYK